MITTEWILSKSREMLEALVPITRMNIASHPQGPAKGFVLVASNQYGGVHCTLEDYGRDKLSQDDFAIRYLAPCVRQMQAQLEYNKEKMLAVIPE